ncbi:hypothetical protein LEMLEM_LOCUS7123 [Lemmus lemmus]
MCRSYLSPWKGQAELREHHRRGSRWSVRARRNGRTPRKQGLVYQHDHSSYDLTETEAARTGPARLCTR